MGLTHVDDEGRVTMVDVGGKADTERVAVARGEVAMRPETLRLIAEKGVPKGDVDFRIDEEASRIEITATARSRGKTGVEMEALTAVSVAALTIYDMAKAVEKTMRIGNIRLVHKRGGKSGEINLE
jgi:cyclic pyranopterin phosphate synthase